MVEETLACIEEENIKYLQAGQISKFIFPMEREMAHEKNVCHLIVRLFIIAITPNNNVLYLVQKRSKNKRSYPEYFTDSASGHVNFQKDLDLEGIKKNALRELEEEFGIHLDAVKKIIFHCLELEYNGLTKEIAYIFYGLVEHDVNLLPDPNEVEREGSKFYTKTELLELFKKEKSIESPKKIWLELLNADILELFERKQIVNNKNNVALFIGRFQPLHHGHIHVIKNILKFHKKIKIGIGSAQTSHTKNDPFTCLERKQFIIATMEKRNIKPERYEILEIEDIYDAEKWVDHVVSIIGNFKVIFSNSDWVRQLFKNKGYKLGKKLVIFKRKYNASNIRKAISRDDNKWTSLVPKEVSTLIKKFGGIERIKSL